MATILHTIDDLDAAWLAAALHRDDLELVGETRIGTGQMSHSHRVTFTAGGSQETVVIKLASADPNSRGTGVGMGAYFREVAFYRELAGTIGEPIPACHFAEYDEAEGWFTLVLEDVVGASQGDQIAGCTVDEARIALRQLARIQAPVLGDPSVGAAVFLNQVNPLTQQLMEAFLPGFLERYADRIAPEHAEVCKRFVAVADAWWEDRRPPLGLIHGDYRLDNLLFSPDGGCRVVDWQTVSWGPAMTDVSYFVSSSLPVEERRAHEEELVRFYHDELRAAGATGLSWEDTWDGYRRTAFYGIAMTIVASMAVERTPRGDDMFMACLERGADQILATDALDLLPEASSAPLVPLQPTAEDEGMHEPGAEPLWNESWYFDAVSDDGSLGVYTRIGRLPNQDCCMHTTCITGPGRPSLMIAGMFPLPDDPAQTVAVDGLHATHSCEAELERFHVVITGTADSHEDHSAPLRDERGTPVEIGFDLSWETVGVPYQWRQATRYEIPCRVTGTVTVDGEISEFAGPGQRDHSWGARDWWSVDWMWNGLHLEDGTHVHQVAIPQIPGFGVGYIQRDGEVTEVSGLDLETTMGDDGLPTGATIAARPADLQLTVEPVAFGALRTEAPDGRVSLFPRAMARVTAADGRTGTGWIEWNLVQRPEA